MHVRGRRVPWFLGSLLLLLVASGSAVRADERPLGPRAEASPEVISELLGLLRLRMEARMQRAELLSRAGRLDEALAALDSVEAMHEQGVARIMGRSALLSGVRGRTRRAGTPAVRVRKQRKPPKRAPIKETETAEEAKAGLIEMGGPANSFRGRGGGQDARSTPGQKKAGDAVDSALRWLAAHQSPNGGWEAEGFRKWCDGKPVSDASKMPDGTGKKLYDPGVTGLALCAFLGAGYTNRGKHPFAKTVSRGLRYLKNIQDPEGCYGPRSTQQYIYSHATAALAMVEAYGMTGSPIFKGSAQRALDFIALARNPYFAWRYGIKPGDNDTSVSGWMLMSLKSAQTINSHAVKSGKPAPLTIDKAAFAGMKAWLDKVTDPDYGRVGYVQRGTGPARPQALVDRFPGEKSESMTAIGVLARVFTGEDPRKSKVIKLGADLMSKLPPVWNPSDGSIDMYYWYQGTLAMFQVGGKHWSKWSKAMDKAMVQTQRKDTDYCQYKGSWDPVGPWGPDGGRIYSTALMAMSLQVFYRYERVFGTK